MTRIFMVLSLVLTTLGASAQAFAASARWSMQLDCTDRRGAYYELHVAVESEGEYNSPSYRETYIAAYVERIPESGPRVSGYMNSQHEFTLKGVDGISYKFVSKAQKLKLECSRPLNGGTTGTN